MRTLFACIVVLLFAACDVKNPASQSEDARPYGLDNGTVGQALPVTFAGGVCALLPLPVLAPDDSSSFDAPVPRTFTDVTVTDFQLDGLGQIEKFYVETDGGLGSWVRIPLVSRHHDSIVVLKAYNDGVPRDVEYLDHEYGLPEYVSMSVH